MFIVMSRAPHANPILLVVRFNQVNMFLDVHYQIQKHQQSLNLYRFLTFEV